MAEERIRDLAYFDSVTGLPNRSFLKEFMSLSIHGAKRNQRILAVLFLDLDNFKCVNDTLGHDAGDILLREVSARLVDCVRSSDYTSHFVSEQKEVAPVTRLGGDEFVIMLTEIKCAENAAQVAKRVADALAVPIAVAATEITVSASIGIAVFPTDGNDAEALLKNADTAMYHAKSQAERLRLLHHAASRPGSETVVAGSQLAQGGQARGVAGSPATAVRCRTAAGRRRRGSDPLAPPRERPGTAIRIHSDSRRDRPGA